MSAYSVGVLLGLVALTIVASQYIRRLAVLAGPARDGASFVLFFFDSAEVQWMTAMCIGVYSVGLTVMWQRLQTKGDMAGPGDRLGWDGKWAFCWPSLLLIVLACVALAVYAFDYGSACDSSDCLTLLAGITFGHAVAVARMKRRDVGCLERVQAILLRAVIFALVLAAVFHPDMGRTFRYREHVRWMGPTFNPNTYGLLMGIGVVLAVGLLVSGFRFQLSGSRVESVVSSRWSVVSGWLKAAMLLVAAGIMAVGLVKSYSRGAWMGTAVGMGYLAWAAVRSLRSEVRSQRSEQQVTSFGSRLSWCQRNRVSLGVIGMALLLLAFWNLRQTEHRAVRRAFSVGNLNDFSWRNRLTASIGALQMMADRPWFGFGWNRVEDAYTNFYRPPTLSESYAIQLNDYAMLGATLGLPALACMLGYVGLKFVRGHRSYLRRNGDVSAMDWQMAVCRSAFLVLFMGFAVERGIFYIALGAPFWVLLELGSGPPIAESGTARVGNTAPDESVARAAESVACN